MRFRLKTLLAVVTATGIALAIWQAVAAHQRRVREHREAFERIDQAVASLDSTLREQILAMPAVFGQLNDANPIDPPMGLSHSITGESQAFGIPQFSRNFHYHWQLADGTRCEGIRITVGSTLDEGSFDDHVVRLTYKPNEFNDEVAQWIDDELGRMDRVQTTHVRQTQ